MTQESPTPTPEQPPAIDPLREALVSAHKTADEFLKMVRDAAAEATHPEFKKRLWEHIRDAALAEVGQAPKLEQKPISPFDKKELADVIGEEEMPRGRYMEMTVAQVYAEDRPYLLDFATNLDPWQIAVQRYIATRDAEVQKPPKLPKQAKAKSKSKKPTTETSSGASEVTPATSA